MGDRDEVIVELMAAPGNLAQLRMWHGIGVEIEIGQRRGFIGVTASVPLCARCLAVAAHCGVVNHVLPVVGEPEFD
ncbi:MAG: hypothetical protein MO846_09435 [Candidatus Devosia symbiotica]|nr:hypothetical protein [Candidatus Devosia symbiotica]